MQLSNYIESYDEWEKRANKVLSHFDYVYPDQIDLFDICWKYGIKIKPLDIDFVSPDIQFKTIEHLESYSIPKKTARKGTIYIKPGLDPIQKKLLLAEEFCHLYSHFASQLNMNKLLLDKMEQQAKRMAAYLLMPSLFLNQVYSAALSEPVLISDIADYFVVTEEFAQYRLELTYKHKVDGFAILKNRLGSVEIYT